MDEWQPIPKEVDTSQAPFDGQDVLIWADSACVNIVRLAWWRNGDEDPDSDPNDRGWWSYRHSVTQELLDFLEPAYWAPFVQPAPLMDEVTCKACGYFYMSHWDKCPECGLKVQPD